MHIALARAPSDGFIVVAVLWILGALATLATVYSVYVINTATALAVNDDRLKSEGLISAGVELAAHQLTAAPEIPPVGRFSFRLGDATIAVEFRSEVRARRPQHSLQGAAVRIVHVDRCTPRDGR